MKHVTVPDDRIGVLVGEGGETMREIESRAEVRLDIDSETGSVRIEFEIVDIEAATRNKNDLRRQKGRLIGEDGRTRELMEELSGADVVIYGTTLGIIGTPEQVDAVRSAAEMILDGAPHGAVYSFLERRHDEMQSNDIEYHQFTG
ncbi:RNA-processing protein [Halobacteriales archaeon QS_9_70_65]|nr:MAG: RNA-processing protein [Halobacteriales archaeon QS_9_70_65]